MANVLVVDAILHTASQSVRAKGLRAIGERVSQRE